MGQRLPVEPNAEDEGDRETNLLLAELRASRSDLARLVDLVSRERRDCIAVSTLALEAWEGREPQAWATVKGWLERRGVEVVAIRENRP